MSEGKIETLLSAIQDGQPWMARFTRKEYKKAYQDYRAEYAPLFRKAALSAGEEGLTALADTLLDGLAAGWARQRPWNRSVAKVSDKQMLVCYLSPMLMEDPPCAPLAEALRAGWAARWPKEAYRIAPAEKLQRGFRNSFLGFTMPSREEEEDE